MLQNRLIVRLYAACLITLSLILFVPRAAQSSSGEAKVYKVPYVSYEGTARRVIVNVTFNERVTVPMALDTGAPSTHISYDLAIKLRALRSNQGKVFVAASGIGGIVPAIRTLIESVSIGGAKTPFVPVTVVDKLSDAFEGLLGMDLLADYNMTIQSDPKVVVLTRKPSSAPRPGGHDERWWRAIFKEFHSYKSAWQRYSEQLERKIKTLATHSGQTTLVKRELEFADWQVKNTERLLSRLQTYASRHAVPRHWRYVR